MLDSSRCSGNAVGRGGAEAGRERTVSAGLYLLCVINYMKSVAALAGHQNELWQHLYKLSLPQECEANLSRCHAPNRVCPASSPFLPLSTSRTASLYLFIMCAANDNRVRAHAALQPQYFANQSGSNSNEPNMPRHGATTSCKQIKETRIRPHDPPAPLPLFPLGRCPHRQRHRHQTAIRPQTTPHDPLVTLP